MNTDNIKTVAVVDDDPFFVEIISENLNRLGFQPEAHLTCKSLLASESLPQYSAIIMDLSMPDCDGIELMRKLSKYSSDVKIIIISGLGSVFVEAATTLATGLGFKMLGSLSKPFSFSEFSRLAELIA